MLNVRNRLAHQGYTGLCYSDNGVPNGWDNGNYKLPAGLSILLEVRWIAGETGSPEEQKTSIYRFGIKLSGSSECV
ncbi:MAG: hypothetical protein R2778_11970 [Saprospiraceae bacterium]